MKEKYDQQEKLKDLKSLVETVKKLKQNFFLAIEGWKVVKTYEFKALY